MFVTLVIVESIVLEAFNTRTFGFMRYLLKGERIMQRLAAYGAFYGADAFLLSPSIPSYPVFSEYRVFRLGYTWNFSFEPTLAAEYQRITGGGGYCHLY